MATIKILGAYGNKGESMQTTCIKLSKYTVIDAGNIIQGLGADAKYIDNIFLTHSHLDHIIDSAFLCDTFFQDRKKSIKIYGLRETIDVVKRHIFNWDIWPDFSQLELPNSSNKALEFIEIKYDIPIKIDGLTLTPIKSNHTVECCGYLIEQDGSGILFSGDTHKNDRVWDILNKSLHVKALIIDVSFPNELEDLGKSSKHLVPKTLEQELKKLKRDDVTIYINHIKSNYQDIIKQEIIDIGLNANNILQGGETIDFSANKIFKKEKVLGEIEKVKMLNKIGSALSANNELTSLLDMIVTEARKLTNADGGTLYLCDYKKEELNFTVVQNSSLDIHMGGKAEEIKWEALSFYLEDKFPNRQMVAVTCALDDKIINIEDAYNVKDFNFEGTKKFDLSTNYRSKSMLVVPLKNHEKKIIGVLQLINKEKNNSIVAFDRDDEDITLSLASQAAVAITNANLIENLEDLLESFLKSIVYAIRRKSPYTANHIHKMVSLSKMFARAIDKDNGFYKDRKFSETKFKMINFAALMHDVGKLSTPDYILDKATKLDGLFDKIEVVKTRAWAIKKELEIEFLKNNLSKTDYERKIVEINYDLKFLVKHNTGSEFMEDKDLKKIEDISKTPIICDGKEFYLITKEEARLLMIKKGTLSEQEREIINDHAQISLDILNKLPFPDKYKEIPSVSGEHHEKINGKGYPQGLKGNEISFESRILAIADIFEALTASDRPYKKANNLSTAMKILYFMAKDDELDHGLVKFFYDSGLYLEFAKKFLKKENIDEVTTDFSSL